MTSHRCTKIATLVLALSASLTVLATLPSQAAATGGSRGGGGHTAPAGPSAPSGPANSSSPPSGESHGLLVNQDALVRPPRHPGPVAVVPSDGPLDRGQCTPRTFYDDDGEPHLVQRCQRRPRFW